jgi:tripartite-type tricarboxylate transporter receptor subunit TctC
MRRIGLLGLVCGAVAAALAAGAPAHAQGYPTKVVQLIVPLAPGGNLDTVARGIAQAISPGLRQQVIVDNRPSASSIVGTQLVARSAPDGYTLLAMANTFTVTPFVAANAGYDPVKQFVGVSQMCWLPNVLVVRPDFPAKTVQELIAYIKANPGKVTVAHSGRGGTGHMAWELFNQQVGGLNVVQVPYKGNAPALIDLLGGVVDVTFDTFSTSIQHIKAGKLRALGLASLKRSPILPDLPVLAETPGLAGFEASIFNGIVAPAGTPRDVLARLQSEIAKAVQQPAFRERFLAQGVELTASESPERFTEFLRRQVDRYAKLVQAVGIKPE